MSRARLLLVLANVAAAALLVWTYGSRLGVDRWHEDAAYVWLSVATILSWPLLRRRRVTSLLLASLGTWCVLTGFWLVYVTPSHGHRGWMTWWHAATGAGFFLVFLAHWARNHPRLVQLARKLAAHRRALAAVAAAWLVVGVGAALSWTLPQRALRSRFADRYLDDVTTAALGLAALAVLAGALLLRRRTRVTAVRNRARGAVDVSLLAATVLATVSALPIQYAGRELRALDGYWIVVAWHIVLSVVLLGLAAAHVTFNRRPLAAHTR